MYLLILETIGTQELILIAIVALIVLGPRKLPQMAKMIGKTMAEFRSATNQFKETWQKEVALEEEAAAIKQELNTLTSDPEMDEPIKPIAKSENSIMAPEIKEISQEEAAKLFKNQGIEATTTGNATETAIENPSETIENSKRSWL